MAKNVFVVTKRLHDSDASIMADTIILIRTLTELTTACLSVINECLLKRSTEVQPLGMQGMFKEHPSRSFEVYADLSAGVPPDYRVTPGALLAILDMCLEIAAQPDFMPDFGEHKGVLERDEPLTTKRFLSYELHGPESSIFSVLGSGPADLKRQKLAWYLFGFAMRFVALHEQGHYMSGHLHLYPRRNVFELGEEKATGQPTGLLADDEELAQAAHWRAMEVEADSFALRNAALTGVYVWNEYQQPASLDEFVATPADWCLFQFLGASIVGLLLSYLAHNRKNSKPLERRRHPSPECRLYGLMSELSYIRSQASIEHGDLSEAWDAGLECTFVALQVIADALDDRTINSFRAVLKSFVNDSPKRCPYRILRFVADSETSAAQSSTGT